MIPVHLKGKSAAQILDEIKTRIIAVSEVETAQERYIAFADAMLLIAIKDALCNADGVRMCDGDHGLMGSEAEGRAIAFLNAVLPKEKCA